MSLENSSEKAQDKQMTGNVKSIRNEADSTWHALWVSFQLLKRQLANSISLGFRSRSWPLVWILFGAVMFFHYELHTVTSGHNKSEVCTTHSFVSLEYTHSRLCPSDTSLFAFCSVIATLLNCCPNRFYIEPTNVNQKKKSLSKTNIKPTYIDW